MNRIRKEYVETGKVRFVYKQLAILGHESVRAAEATECAAEQDAFWSMHDHIFIDLATSRSTYHDQTLTQFAAELGLDDEAFNSCLTSDRHSGLISQDRDSIKQLGVSGTPAFVINGMYVSGARPYEVFQEIIEELLTAAGSG